MQKFFPGQIMMNKKNLEGGLIVTDSCIYFGWTTTTGGAITGVAVGGLIGWLIKSKIEKKAREKVQAEGQDITKDPMFPSFADEIKEKASKFTHFEKVEKKNLKSIAKGFMNLNFICIDDKKYTYQGFQKKALIEHLQSTSYPVSLG